MWGQGQGRSEGSVCHGCEGGAAAAHRGVNKAEALRAQGQGHIFDNTAPKSPNLSPNTGGPRGVGPAPQSGAGPSHGGGAI